MIEYNEYERQGLKGPVKQLKEEHFNAFENDGLTYIGKPSEGFNMYNNRLILFDEQHNVRETEHFLIEHVYKTIFDTDGNVIENISYDPGNNNIIKSKSTFNYTDDISTNESISYNNKNEISYRSSCILDNQKRITERIQYNVNSKNKDEILERYVWEFSGDFKSHTKVTIYNAEGNIVRVTEQVLNQLGHGYKTIEYNPNGEVTKINDYSYLFNDDGTPKKVKLMN